MSQKRLPSHRQEGLTFISWIFVLAIGVFFVLIGIKMVPVYLEYFAIRDVLHNVAQDRSSRDMSKRQLKRSLLKRFRINGVYDFKREDIHIEKSRQGRQIRVEYEVRKPVVGNVSLVMSFSHSVPLPQ
ncbi:MAG: DUF4845 domain-containing protein [Gammaproteobacteria bacterium]|nr:MAG: DUF4845 domain-containing protein [Gammaproteobacteria bacterium]